MPDEIETHEVCPECGGLDGQHDDDCEDLIDTALIVEDE